MKEKKKISRKTKKQNEFLDFSTEEYKYSYIPLSRYYIMRFVEEDLSWREEGLCTVHGIIRDFDCISYELLWTVAMGL